MPARTRMSPARRFALTDEQRARESSIVLAVVADAGILTTFVVVGVIGGSFTILAESVRGWLMLAIDAFSLLVMRRIHRGVLTDLEFGPGKLEQVVNLLIAAGMLVGAGWIAAGALSIVAGERPAGAPLGLALAAVCGAINLYINVVTWDAVRRAARAGGSVIMRAQLTARIIKLFSSLVVLATMTVAAHSRDPAVASWADAAGSLFVAAFIVVSALGMIRSGLPDLLDRSVEEEIQIAINRALARHFDDYDRLDRVRSRRSGDLVFVEVALGFDSRLTMDEVDRRMSALKSTMRREIRNADISILLSPHPA